MKQKFIIPLLCVLFSLLYIGCEDNNQPDNVVITPTIPDEFTVFTPDTILFDISVTNEEPIYIIRILKNDSTFYSVHSPEVNSDRSNRVLPSGLTNYTMRYTYTPVEVGTDKVYLEVITEFNTVREGFSFQVVN